ncbi:hypothetical protein C8Q76DRAFT_425546 [Earliella scabrosa]|nr:hypothetical protein C8Q76DRAFT_425546 [Earliella scabrosa]
MVMFGGQNLHSRQAASTVTCLPEFDWMINSKGQNPCLVASWGVVPCVPNGWIIQPLSSPADRYGGPGPGSRLWNCRCNTVHYSLIAACATCQGYPSPDGVSNFTGYARTCPPNILQGAVYPQDIPPETAIPAWAYLDLVDDRWDEVAASALAVQNLPESTHSEAPTSTFSTSSETSTSASPNPAPSGTASTGGSSSDSPTPESRSGESRNIIGPAVGGAVAGLAVLVLAGIAMFLCLRRRHAKVSAHRHSTFEGMLVPADAYYGQDYTKTTLYDPDDPSTFPPPRSTREIATMARESDGGSADSRGRPTPTLGRSIAEIQIQ